MRVRVLFFGVLKDLAGKAADDIDLPEGASVRDVIARYESAIPRLKGSLSSVALAVNREYQGPDARLKAGDEVALLPPVSGGSIDGESIDAGAEPGRGLRRHRPEQD
jgi:molybdopterin converting factor subunit 1